MLLDRVAALAEDAAVRRAEEDAEKVRNFHDFRYAAKSWKDKERRVIARIEAIRQGSDTRFVVTNLSGTPRWLYESRCTEALLACPFLILAIAFGAFLGQSLENAMIAIGIAATPIFIRLTRGQTLAVKTEDYVEGARAVGASHPRILWRYILPNVLPPIMVQATLTIALAIIAEASLAFLGLGLQPPAPSWGSMLDTARQFLSQAPWMALVPGLAIFLTVFGFNLLGDGLRDALDPRDA